MLTPVVRVCAVGVVRRQRYRPAPAQIVTVVHVGYDVGSQEPQREPSARRTVAADVGEERPQPEDSGHHEGRQASPQALEGEECHNGYGYGSQDGEVQLQEKYKWQDQSLQPSASWNEG